MKTTESKKTGRSTKKAKLDAQWRKVEAIVLANFDLSEVATNHAVKRWKDHAEKVRSLEGPAEIVSPFASPEAIDAVVEFFRSDINEDIALFEARRCHEERSSKLTNLRAALAAQGQFIDEKSGEHISPEHLGIDRVDRVKLLSQIICASRSLASDDGDSETPVWPQICEGFAEDLADLMASCDEAREVVLSVCDDLELAKKIAADPDMPKPLVFLAKAAIEIGGNNRLPSERRIGFARR